MSIRISLDAQPEFYTNLDHVRGRIILSLNRPEQIGLIVVKLEGEARTALAVPPLHETDGTLPPGRRPMPGAVPGSGAPGDIAAENHKILYKVQQVFPDEHDVTPSYVLQPGQHEYPFRFKLPFNNACSDQLAMSRIGGIAGVGGFGTGPGLFGLGGIRVMDGSKQLFLRHVTKTLPPSLTGFPRMAEIRYYVKVTIQRPGFLKENWRYHVGFKFLPIEPPRPVKTGQEAFVKRMYAFQPRSPMTPTSPLKKKRSGLFGSLGGSSSGGAGKKDGAASSKGDLLSDAVDLPPEIEMSARLPHPAILTCNQPIPLRLIATKRVPSSGQVFLSSLEIALIGTTSIRCHDLSKREVNRWVVVSRAGLSIPLTQGPSEEMGSELVLPDDLWSNVPLPNSITPSFLTCNLSRTYELEIRLGLTWGKPVASTGFLTPKQPFDQQQQIFLPLTFSKVEVFSGIAPPAALLDAIAQNANRPSEATLEVPPRLPPRTAQSAPVTPTAASIASPGPLPQSQNPRPYDPLYPPQLGAPGAPPYDDAPPSYDEAMAEEVTGPFDGLRPRPAYSGVTNENAPSQIPEKS